MAFNANSLLPLPSQAELRQAFIGKTLRNVPTPAAVLDRAVVQRNCLQMLKACEALQVGFRPHVKTHKVYLHAFLTLYPISVHRGTDSLRSVRDRRMGTVDSLKHVYTGSAAIRTSEACISNAASMM